MKSFLTASVLANILLATLVFCLLHPRRAAEKSAPAAALAGRPPKKHPSSSPPETLSPVPTFRWSQLESTNYRIYIANLRAIGCPPQTVRDIITADVDEAFYLPRREALKQRQSGPALENTLAELAEEETGLVTTLLGGDIASSRPAASSSPRLTEFRHKSPAERDLERPVSMPLIFQPTDLAAMKLNEAQLQIITELRQAFTEQVGTNQDPNDPVYRQHWQTAQREADSMLASMLGRKFVLNYRSELENQPEKQATSGTN